MMGVSNTTTHAAAIAAAMTFAPAAGSSDSRRRFRRTRPLGLVFSERSGHLVHDRGATDGTSRVVSGLSHPDPLSECSTGRAVAIALNLAVMRFTLIRFKPTSKSHPIVVSAIDGQGDAIARP